MPAMSPVALVLELARASDSGDPHAFRFEPQEYLLRPGSGGYESARFPWDDALLADLTAVGRPDGDPAVVQRLGIPVFL